MHNAYICLMAYIYFYLYIFNLVNLDNFYFEPVSHIYLEDLYIYFF